MARARQLLTKRPPTDVAFVIGTVQTATRPRHAPVQPANRNPYAAGATSRSGGNDDA